MRVMHVIDSGGLYGAEQVLLLLCQEQQALGMEPVIASIGTPDWEVKPLEAEGRVRGIRVAPFRMRAGPNYWGAWQILNFARREEMTLLHLHGYRANFLLGTLPRPLRRVPLVSTLHGYASLDGWSRIRMYEWLDARLLSFLDAVALVDESVLSHRRFRGVRPFRYRVVRNGIGAPPEIGSSGPLDQDLLTICRGGSTVAAIGRLSREKGFDLLIEAVRLAEGKGTFFRLVIFGEGEERTRLEAAVAGKGLAGRVFLPGFLPEARQYLPHVHAFVLPSRSEGLPMTLLEAMQAGVPIIATRVGGMPEALGHGTAGLLVPPDSPEHLAEALLTLERRPLFRRRLAERARHRVRQHYSGRRMALEYEAIYRSLLDSGRART